MDHAKNQNVTIIAIVATSVLYASLEIVAALKGRDTSSATGLLWAGIFALAIALWTSNDAKRRSLYKPYEYSYLVFLFWPFVLPYHLVRTRGVEGLLIFFCVMGLHFLPFMSGLVAWAYFA